MEFGIICEGIGDRAVLENILYAVLGEDLEQIIPLRPEDQTDETDRHAMTAGQFSSWTLVKKECISGEKIRNFLGPFAGNDRIIVLQIDSAECGEIGYDVIRPSKENLKKYSAELRARIIDKMKEWMGENSKEEIIFAVCIEEMEAWLLAHYETRDIDDTCTFPDPKNKYNQVINKKFEKNKKVLRNSNEYSKMKELSRPLRKNKELQKARTRNHSLHQFIESLPAKND
ncbi:MAG: hypothetical protein H6581_15005 [Bacteroidia bacterium]|nr:hypothetical protein [Bacteroidia bacterium]